MNCNKSLKKYQGGVFPGLSDEGVSMMGCPFFLEQAPDQDDNLSDETNILNETDSTSKLFKTKTDTVTSIRYRKRERNKVGNGGIGGFFQRLFKKKDKKDSTLVQ